MPEGPEHHLAARSINKDAADRVFGGKIVRSDVVIATGNNKHPDLSWDCPAYKIVACARGKEVKLTLSSVADDTRAKKGKAVQSGLDIYFQFGMSGYFRFTSPDDLPKHSHLRFFTCDNGESKVLSFVDPRRFGRWRCSVGWSEDRSPDPLFEYSEFRQFVVNNLNKPAFNRAICEVLLNQQYFNGIGNYLRAEILFRGGVRPFDCARDVLNQLPIDDDLNVKSENPDVLRLCHIIGNEILTLNKCPSADPWANYELLKTYLKCYGNPVMNNLTDSNGRTIWFTGQPGKLVPAKAKHTHRHAKKRNLKSDVSDDPLIEANVEDPKKIVKREKSLLIATVKSGPENYSGPTTRSKTVSLKR